MMSLKNSLYLFASYGYKKEHDQSKPGQDRIDLAYRS